MIDERLSKCIQNDTRCVEFSDTRRKNHVVRFTHVKSEDSYWVEFYVDGDDGTYHCSGECRLADEDIKTLRDFLKTTTLGRSGPQW